MAIGISQTQVEIGSNRKAVVQDFMLKMTLFGASKKTLQEERLSPIKGRKHRWQHRPI